MFHIKPPLQISDELKLRVYSQQPLDWTLSTSMALEFLIILIIIINILMLFRATPHCKPAGQNK